MGDAFVHTIAGQRQLVIRGRLIALAGSAATLPGRLSLGLNCDVSPSRSGEIQFKLDQRLAACQIADVAINEAARLPVHEFVLSRYWGAGHVCQDFGQSRPMYLSRMLRLCQGVSRVLKQTARHSVQFSELVHSGFEGPKLSIHSLLSSAVRHILKLSGSVMNEKQSEGYNV